MWLPLRKWVGWLVIAVMLGAWADRAHASATLTLSDSIGAPGSVTINPGSSFAITVNLTTNLSLYGFTAYLDDNAYTGTTHFTFTGRTTLTPFQSSDSNTDDIDLLGTPLVGPSIDGVADPALDLGYVQGSAMSAISKNVETITLTTASNLAAGNYILQFDVLSNLVDSNFNSVAFDNQTSTYLVTVVAPEPSMLCLLPAAVLLYRRRRSIRRV